MNEGQLPRGECFLRPTEAPLSFLEVDQGKSVAFPTDGREAFDSLSNPFNSHLSGNFRLFDSSFTHMVTTRSMDDVPACVAIDAAMDRFPVSA
ncbi:hypothetical protein P4129_21020 [Pseudomonas aeruginosa]|nr:hypothetical protein [Pseudomonas aeruginosa]